MNEQQEAWSGGFGQEYTARNRVRWLQRVPFWRTIMHETGARSVYEVGCNAAWNLSAIKYAVDWDVKTYGHDVNHVATTQAARAGHDVVCQSEMYLYGPSVDLAFTCGVLIHQAPDALAEMMREIVQVSAQYVLAVEYEADELTGIEYRGQQNLLWKGPYGRMYQDMGLRLVTTINEPQGFDRCTAWLLEKQA